MLLYPATMQQLAALMGGKIATAEDGARPAYNLQGRLYLAPNGWLVLSVPNALGHGLFAAMNEPGIELPVFESDGRFNAAIAVMTPEELRKIGGPEKVTERGKSYRYTTGRLIEVSPPSSWAGIAKAWLLRVHSPDLQQLRISYGLSALPGGDLYDFHVCVAVRKKGVMGRNDVGKVPHEESSDDIDTSAERISSPSS